VSVRAALVSVAVLAGSIAWAGDPTDEPGVAAESSPAVEPPAPVEPEPARPVRKPPESPPTIAAWEDLPNGLKIADLVVGTGATPSKGQPVTVEYTGWVADSGSRFDSSLSRQGPFQFNFGAGQVILGWEKGLRDMKVGGRRVLWIPAYLGYGASGAGDNIPPHADLIFEVELLATE
jgi:peptidylprolyl isomerase